MSCDQWAPRTADSIEYVWATITAENAAGATIDPTGDTIAWAFTEGGAVPALADFDTAGVWRTITTGPLPEYQAGVLIGPGALALAAGRWRGWVKVTDSPEVPIRQVGEVLHIL